ncbi:MAG: STAS domain-containing protein [Armatimonadota bacterium]
MKPHDRPESTLSTQIVDGVPVVEITGALDLSNIDALSATVAELAREHSGGIVVALKTTTYLDSRGVDGLIRCAQWLAQGRRGLVVAIPRAALPRRILEIAGLGSNLSIFETVDEAVAAARAMG